MIDHMPPSRAVIRCCTAYLLPSERTDPAPGSHPEQLNLPPLFGSVRSIITYIHTVSTKSARRSEDRWPSRAYRNHPDCSVLRSSVSSSLFFPPVSLDHQLGRSPRRRSPQQNTQTLVVARRTCRHRSLCVYRSISPNITIHYLADLPPAG